MRLSEDKRLAQRPMIKPVIGLLRFGAVLVWAALVWWLVTGGFNG